MLAGVHGRDGIALGYFKWEGAALRMGRGCNDQRPNYRSTFLSMKFGVRVL